jgi:GT2 family glycosyltransferase
MGINRAKCPILAFLDDDCLPDFEWLEQVYEVLKHNRFNIVKGSNSNGYPKNIVACAYHFFVESVINSGIYHFGQNKYCLYLDTKNFAARKILFDRIGLFDNRFSKYSAMYDLDLSERIRRKRMRILYCPRMKATHYGRSGLSNFLLRCFEMGMARCTFYAIWHISKSEGLKGLKSIYNNRITVNIKKYRYKVNRKMIIGFTVNKTGIWIIGFRFVNYLGSVFSFLGYQLESLRLFMRKAIHGPGHL